MTIMPPELDDFLFTYGGTVDAVGVNALLGLAMYVVLAVGQLSVGQAAFMGLGAYGSGLVAVQTGLPMWLLLPVAAAVPVVVAMAIGVPTLRLSGVHLAIATIGLGEVLRATYNNLDIVGGAMGLSGIAQPDPQVAGTLVIYALLILMTVAFWRLAGTGVGRAMAAMRGDPMAARAVGIPIDRFGLVALCVSAAIAGVAGALEAWSSGTVSPNSYGFEPAVTILAYALLGGTATPLGPVLGAVVLTLLPEVLRPLSTATLDLRLVVDGLVIVAVVLFRPSGLLTLRLRRG